MDVQQGSALLDSAPDFKLEAQVNKTDAASALSSPIRASLAPTFTSPMQHCLDPTEIWQQVCRSLSAESEAGDLSARVATALGNAFRVDACVLILPIQTRQGLQVSSWLSSCPDSLTLQTSYAPIPIETLPCLEGVAISDVEALSALTLEQATVKALLSAGRSLHAPESLLQIRAILAIPTRSQGNTNGMIGLIRSHPHPWSDAEVEGIHLIAQQVALIFSQYQLQHQLSQQRAYQRVVNQVTMAIRNSADLSDILKLAIDGTAEVLQVQRAILLQLKYWDPLFKQRTHHQAPKVKVAASYEWLRAAKPVNQFTMPASQESGSPQTASTGNQSFWMSDCALCERAFIDPSQPIVVPDTQQLLAVNPTLKLAPILSSDTPSALLLVPLESQGTVLGFLVLQCNHPREWQPEDVDLVDLIGAQISTAIVRAETLRQVQSLVEKRTAELRQSISIQAKLYERTRLQVDQLRHLNQLKDEFLSTISHELRTPLTSMTMAIRMLRQTGLSDDRSRRYLDILEQQCTQETNLINDLLALQELESEQIAIQPQELDLNQLLQEVTTVFPQQWLAKGLTLETDLPKHRLRLQSDPESLHRILLELLTNAGKYSDPNTTVKLSVLDQSGPSSSAVVLTLSNIGAAIASEDLPHIFDKFRRASGATQNAVQGTGLGLALVKCLVQLLNGTITVTSTPTVDTQSYETCFTVTLPKLFDNTRL